MSRIVVMVMIMGVADNTCAMNEGTQQSQGRRSLRSWWSEVPLSKELAARDAVRKVLERDEPGELQQVIQAYKVSDAMLRQEMVKHGARRKLADTLKDQLEVQKKEEPVQIMSIIEAVRDCQLVGAEVELPEPLCTQTSRLIESCKARREIWCSSKLQDGWKDDADVGDRLREAILTRNIPGVLANLEVLRLSTGKNVQHVLWTDEPLPSRYLRPTLLHTAVRDLDEDLVQQLVKSKAAVNVSAPTRGGEACDGTSPLCEALGRLSQRAHRECAGKIVTLLLSGGADVNLNGRRSVNDKNPQGPLWWALVTCQDDSHNTEVVRQLLDHGANCSTMVPEVCQLDLERDARKNLLDMALRAGAPVGDDMGLNSLKRVIAYRKVYAPGEPCEVAQWLIDKGAPLDWHYNQNDNYENIFSTILSSAVKEDLLDMVRLLVRAGARVEGYSDSRSLREVKNKVAIAELLWSAGTSEYQMYELIKYTVNDCKGLCADAQRVRRELLSGQIQLKYQYVNGAGVDGAQNAGAAEEEGAQAAAVEGQSKRYEELRGDVLCREQSLAKKRALRN